MNKLTAWLDSFPPIKRRSSRLKGASEPLPRKFCTKPVSRRKQSVGQTDYNYEFLYVPFNRNETPVASGRRAASTSCDRWDPLSESSEDNEDHAVRYHRYTYLSLNRGYPTSPQTLCSKSVSNSCSIQEATVPDNPMSPKTLSRTLIRTNPWLPHPVQRDPVPALAKPTAQLSVGSITPGHFIRQSCNGSLSFDKLSSSLDESFSSSGYGTHDSSPETSIHSPNWCRPSPSSEKSTSLTPFSNAGSELLLPRSDSIFVDKAVECKMECSAEEDDLSLCGCCKEDWLEYESDEDDGYVEPASTPKTLDDPELVPPRLQVTAGEHITEQKQTEPLQTPRRLDDLVDDLSKKLYSLQQIKCSVQRTVDKAKADRDRVLREREYYQEQLQFIKELKLVLNTSFEVML